MISMLNIMSAGFSTSPYYVCSEERHPRMYPRRHMITDYNDGILVLRRHLNCKRNEERLGFYISNYKKNALPSGKL